MTPSHEVVDHAHKVAPQRLRQPAERELTRRNEEVQAEMQSLVTDAQARAELAEERLAAALERAEVVRRESEVHSQTLLGNARNNADEIISESREHAEGIISEAVADAERERTAAQHEVEELNRQRESITGYLDDLRSLLSNDPIGNLAAATRLKAPEVEASASDDESGDEPKKNSKK